MSNTLLRSVPGIDATKVALFARYPAFSSLPNEFVRYVLSVYWDGCRNAIRAGRITSPAELDLECHIDRLALAVANASESRFTQVINATGVVVHTNLGRSELCTDACAAVLKAASGYSNLEFDLETGKRGSRHALTEDILRYLTGAESALIVNNNAAAVLLMLDTFCKGREVIVSRGELVEIGGSFRMPEVMAKGGAILREVGATNRTHLKDYTTAISAQTAAIMRVHTSNYRIIGFHSRCELKELAELAHANGLLLLVDLGSGSLIHFDGSSLPDEPIVAETIAAGADIVSFSGDKLLGGPQAGILAGKRECIEKLKNNQLTRALRCDKLCLAALDATLRVYIDPDRAKREIPTLRRIFLSSRLLHEKALLLAEKLKAALGSYCAIRVVEDVSRVGGGAFPQYDLPTSLVALIPDAISAETLKQRLLKTKPPVIGRLEANSFCLDPRTLEEKDLSLLTDALKSALSEQ